MKKIYSLLIAAVAAPTLMFAQPANSSCDTAPVTAVVTDGAIASSMGTGVDAINNADELDVEHVWEAFTITECSDVTIDLCGTDSVQGFIYQFVTNSCPIDLTDDASIFAMDGAEFTTCAEGNPTSTWMGLEAGTYYYPIVSAASAQLIGDYTVNFTAVTCVIVEEPDSCLTYTANGGNPWGDFNPDGAPAPDADGNCTANLIDAFEVFASEAYTIDNFVTGTTYTFSFCEGGNAGAWDAAISVTDPDGNVVAYVEDCSVTWTAEMDGSFVIGISEVDHCFDSANTGTSNGFPSITCEGTDGVFNADKLENITVYPNPSNGVFNVMNSGVADTYQIRVFDITGKQVVEEQVVLTNGGQYTIDLGTAAKGVYTVQFVSPSNTGALRIVKN